MVFSGERFGRLVVVGFSHNDKRARRHYSVKCDCGTEKTVQGTLLRSGNTSSCGCLIKDSANARRLSETHSDVTAVMLGYKRHAHDRGYEWALSRAEVESIIFKNCAYCGIPPSNQKTTKNSIKPLRYSGIDRVDNRTGYVAGNVVPCCSACNTAKRTMTVDEFFEWADRVARMAQQWSEYIINQRRVAA